MNFKEYDIYSFGSIIYSFFCSKDSNSLEMYDSNNRKESLIFLNNIDEIEKDMPLLVRDIVRACWEEDYQKRPLFDDICHLFIEYFKEDTEI